MNRGRSMLAVALCLLMIAGFTALDVLLTRRSPEMRPRAVQVREIVLGRPPVRGALPEYTRVSPDASHVAYVHRNGAGALFVDGERTAAFDAVAPCISFSPNARHVALAVRRGTRWFLAVDGKVGPAFGRIETFINADRSGIGIVRWEPLGARAAYVGIGREGRTQVSVDLDTLEHVREGPAALWQMRSPDGRHVAEVRERDSSVAVIRDGDEGEPFDEIRHTNGHWTMSWSPCSRHFAYAARRGEHWHMVVDGELGFGFAGIDGKPQFSPTGDRMWYRARRPYGRHETVLVDLTARGPGGRERRIEGKWTVSYSPDGRRCARVGPTAVVVDGEPVSPVGSPIGQAVFSPDAKRLAYWTRAEGAYRVVAESKPGPASDYVTDLRFSPDGRRLAYAVRRNDRWRLVVDGQPGTAYASIARYCWSPDSRHVACLARRRSGESEQAVLVVDDLEVGPYADDLRAYGNKVVFDGSNALHTVMMRKDTAVRVDVTIPPGL